MTRRLLSTETLRDLVYGRLTKGDVFRAKDRSAEHARLRAALARLDHAALRAAYPDQTYDVLPRERRR